MLVALCPDVNASISTYDTTSASYWHIFLMRCTWERPPIVEVYGIIVATFLDGGADRHCRIHVNAGLVAFPCTCYVRNIFEYSDYLEWISFPLKLVSDNLNLARKKPLSNLQRMLNTDGDVVLGQTMVEEVVDYLMHQLPVAEYKAGQVKNRCLLFMPPIIDAGIRYGVDMQRLVLQVGEVLGPEDAAPIFAQFEEAQSNFQNPLSLSSLSTKRPLDGEDVAELDETKRVKVGEGSSSQMQLVELGRKDGGSGVVERLDGNIMAD